jgi:hypothetical protein
MRLGPEVTHIWVQFSRTEPPPSRARSGTERPMVAMDSAGYLQAMSDDALSDAIERAKQSVSREQELAKQKADRDADRAAFVRAQTVKIHELARQYAQRLESARQRTMRFRERDSRTSEILKGYSAYLVGYHARSSSDYSLSDYMERIMVAVDGSIWGAPHQVRKWSPWRERNVLCATRYPFISAYVDDIAGFTEMLAHDFARRTTDASYLATLMSDKPGYTIPWTWG